MTEMFPNRLNEADDEFLRSLNDIATATDDVNCRFVHVEWSSLTGGFYVSWPGVSSIKNGLAYSVGGPHSATPQQAVIKFRNKLHSLIQEHRRRASTLTFDWYSQPDMSGVVLNMLERACIFHSKMVDL